jgi:hypothetical protein
MCGRIGNTKPMPIEDSYIAAIARNILIILKFSGAG